MRSRAALLIAVGAAIFAAACSPEPAPKPGAGAESRPRKEFPGGFVDATRDARISFRHENGARGEKLLPETMGSGIAFLDYDSDGILDLVFVDSGIEGGHGYVGAASFLGRPDGTFAPGPAHRIKSPDAGHPYAMGVSAADYDGDGDDDVFLTSTKGNILLRNDGGKLEQVGGLPTTLGERPPFWATASLWCDYDRDGDLDLFVAGYVQWTPETEIFTSLDGVTKAFTTPDRYTGLPVRLYRNKGDGTFEDATVEAGLAPHLGKGLGIAMWDFDGNGYPDIVVANDTRPNFVFMNQGNGKFTEEGLALRVAYDENGRARAGMGIDIADYANDGVPGIAIGNFAGEPMSLYRAGKDGFTSAAEKAGLAAATTLSLAFGVAFADLDLDGIQDLVVVNGHIEPDIAKFRAEQTYTQSPLLFLGVPGGAFADATASAGRDFDAPRVGRGLAIGDYDRDGDLDLVITENGGPAVLLRSRLMETAPTHWLRVVLRGAGKNTRGIGALITLEAAGKTQTRLVHTGSSYLSQSDVFPTFGLGGATKVDALRVRWPGGAVRVYPVDQVDRTITLTE